MAMPTDIGIIDLMLDIPSADQSDWYEFLKPQLREESKDHEFPAQYMFRDVPHVDGGPDPVGAVLKLMDHHGIERAMLGVGFEAERTTKLSAVQQHPDRFIGSFNVDPNKGMEGVRDLVKAYETLGIKSAIAFPAGYLPQVPINDKKFFPLYAKCIELDIPICVTTGICVPRVPSACQDTMLIDEVCWFFPELKFVMRHGAEPWADLAAKLLLKWPNLYYSTSAFAPRYYPQAIVDFANTRGADKVMYAGYFPMGLSLERIFADLPGVPFKAEVWPKFLRENAMRVFKLDA
ncbi:MAG: putative TIM-barrel fold metal-dependent hydrolase [Acidimicrobiales bacterium]|nr:putative TIM-barrel fold metal-dependent hydrolase [Acidimicrobiales bacterium]